MVEHVSKLKWQWIGHAARQDPESSTQLLLNWRPRLTKSSVGRPLKRWIKDVKTITGVKWMTIARN